MRARRDTFTFDDKAIVDRVLKFFEDDNAGRSEEKDMRLQRYAKYRMWTEEKDWPWEGASNIPLSDMLEKGLRVDDTLHNAVMSTRPVINAAAVDQRNADAQDSIDQLIDYQVFVEQAGEEKIGDLANAMTTDGEAIAFIPWVRELRETSDSRTFGPIPADAYPADYFQMLVSRTFQADTAAQQIKGDGWDWILATGDGPAEVSFYAAAEGGPVEMVVRREAVVYDGPLIVQKEWDDVLYPARAANLHIPGPSNPHGAGHVILVDYPSLDEVRNLARHGVYDRIDPDTLESLAASGQDGRNREHKDQKDAIQGTASRPGTDENSKTKPQKTVTRLMCFDVYDAREDGKAVDMVWTVILETKTLARAKLLTELYPARVPRRPIEHEAFIPVRGRVSGIGIPELLEGLHDAMKAILDQTVDGGTMKIAPPWFYRPFGGMKPETIRLAPGEGYPLGDPTRDVHFPTANTQAETMGLNMVAVLGQMEERLAMVGELQLGRVPQGKASALRTVGGMSLIAGQGEARPERLLRRFFGLLARIWRQIHERNRYHLPDEKRIRILGVRERGQDAYATIRRDLVDAPFLFDFKANVLNTSKEAMQQGIDRVMSVGVSAIAIQLGITQPEGFYRMVRDHAKAWGADPDQYYTEPAPGAMKRRIFAEEAVSTIIDGGIPDGMPAEGGGAAEHLQKLMAFMDPNQDLIAGKEVDFDEFGLLDAPEKIAVFTQYTKDVAELAAQQQREAALSSAAAQFGQPGAQPAGPGGRPPEGPPQDPNEPVMQGPGELSDESLPGAGGGANPGLGLAG
jgi:hypothetical protein